jgi:predicted AAA+ superfamily ATPase
MFNRLLKLPLNGNSSIFLFGPRGTGKTSWLKSNLQDYIYLDLLDYSIYSSLVANPNRLDAMIPKDYDKWVIIDEVQRVPELLNEVHRLIEGRKIKFILTGSSARSLRKKGVNLLAGRALKYHMHPLVIQEVGESFKMENALTYGLLPKIFSEDNPKKYLESYVQTYLKEEIQQEGLARNIGSFNRFLEVASFSQGSVINFSEIAREVMVSRFTVADYFQILEDMLIAIRIDVFSKRAKRKIVAHQKFYFFDAGVYRILKPTNPLDTMEEGDGAALETLFLQSLRAINDYFDLGYNIYFWRTSTGVEVDFILYGPKGFHAFEIKRSKQTSTKSFGGLKAFGQDYPEAKLHLLFFGTHTEYHGEITAIPFEQALKDLPKILG